MKKLIVLAIVMLLASTAVWGQVVTFGEVETRWLNDYTNKTFAQAPEVIVGVKGTVDANNEIYIELEEGPRAEFTGTSAAGFSFDKAHFTTDMGAIFGLPVGLTWRTGFDEYDPFDASKVTWGEWEDVIGSDLHAWGNEVNIDVEMVTIRTAWGNDFGAKQFLAGIGVDLAPIWAEVSYVNYEAAEDFGTGDIEAGVEFAQDVADGISVAAAATMDYDLEEATSGDSEWTAGAGAVATYMDMVSLGVAWAGMQDFEAGGMQVDLWAQPSADIPLEVFIAAGLGLDEDLYAETFDSLEGSLKYMFGASTWYLGAMYIADGGVGIAREKSNFVTPATDSTSLFMRAELKY